jgi:hypothetical protein
MNRLGFVTLAHLGELQRKGMKPEQAFNLLKEEAKQRNPAYPTIIMQREPNGFAIIGLPL